jgi:hypothetical protein
MLRMFNIAQPPSARSRCHVPSLATVGPGVTSCESEIMTRQQAIALTVGSSLSPSRSSFVAGNRYLFLIHPTFILTHTCQT